MDETVLSDYLIGKEEIKMELKSFIKKVLITVLTLAVCIPVIMKVASANASEGATVDVAIQFFDAAGNPVTNVNAGDQVTIKVTLTPKNEEGTPVGLESIDMFSADIYIDGFEGVSNISLENQMEYTGTFTVEPCFDANYMPSCEVVNGLAYYNISVSANDPNVVGYEEKKQSFEFSKKESLTTPIAERPTGPSTNPGGGDSNEGSGGNSNNGSSSSGGSSNPAPAAGGGGGGAAAPAGNGGAAGNAGASTVGGIYTATSMNNVAVTSPLATVAAAAGLSEADVAAGANVRTYICDSRDREMKDALKAVAETGGRSVVAYLNVDLYTITKAGVITNVRNTAAPVTITFGLPGSLANAGHSYSILCLNPDGTPALFEDIDTNNATITINATAFGTYAVVINP